MIKTADILVDALSEVLETMAFLDIFPVDGDMRVPGQAMLGHPLEHVGQRKPVDVLHRNEVNLLCRAAI